MSKESVKNALENPGTYVDGKELVGKTKGVDYMVVQTVPERKNVNGVWIGTGREIVRATIIFNDGTFTRTRSQHILDFIGARAADYIPAPNGFAIELDGMVEFFYRPTVYANGKTYDVLSTKQII